MDDGTMQGTQLEQPSRGYFRLLRAVVIGVLGAVGVLTLVATFASASTTPSGLHSASATAPATGPGYVVVGADGGAFSFGSSPYRGSMGGQPLNSPIVGVASTPRSGGYWQVASDGGIFGFGNATFFGSMGGKPLNAPIVGIASTRGGGGYWEVASDGGIFSFGDAGFFGSMGGHALNAPIVGIASTPDGKGYWEVASDGGIFSFGDATFFGSMGGQHLNDPIVGIASTSGGGGGYWEVASDGGIFTFGAAAFDGSMGGHALNQPVVGIAAVPNGGGYWEVAKDGGVFAFGDAPSDGSLPAQGVKTGDVVGMTASAAPALAPFPTLTSFSPLTGPTSGGNAVTLTGANLLAPATVSFGANPATSVVATGQTITATAPAGTGTVDISVTTLGGSFKLLQAYTYEAFPSVTSVSPNAGVTAGFTAVTITGTNFTADSTVTFGSEPAVSVVVNSSTSLTATSPPGSPGTVDVTVTTPVGMSAISSADQYSYEDAPSVTSISPDAGPTAGGTSVTVTGTNFTSDSTVSFGIAPATGVTRNSATSLTVTSPAGSPGLVDVTVTTDGGTSSTSSSDQYTYDAPPTVTSLSPNTAPAGTTIIITGSNFTPNAQVTFGGTVALGAGISPTSFTAMAPVTSAGTVDVTVTTPGGTSATSSADEFTTDSPLDLTATPSTSTEVGVAYSQTNTPSGGSTPYAYAVSSGTVPQGTTLNAITGTVSGTATAAGPFNYTVQVTDFNGSTATQTSSGTIASLVSLAATPSADTEVGLAYSQTNTASGGTAPYTYAVTSGTLPQGTIMNPATGTFVGSPTMGGAFSYTITVTDSDGATASQTTSGTIADELGLVTTPSTDTEVGVAYSQTNDASGGTAPYTYSAISGNTPQGTLLNSATGTLSGTPTTSGSFSYTVQVTDSDGATATQTTSGTIASTLTLVATPSANTEIPLAYSQTNVASGGTAPYSYSVSAGTVPAGTTLNASTGTVSGAPTASGAFSYTIEATDSDGATATQTTSGTIIA